MDLFHCQVEEGDLAIRIRKYLADPKQTRVGHFQIAGVPERHEPDTGEVHYSYLFDLIDQLGYEGWIGCEYIPAAATRRRGSVGLEVEERLRACQPRSQKRDRGHPKKATADPSEPAATSGRQIERSVHPKALRDASNFRMGHPMSCRIESAKIARACRPPTSPRRM